MKDELYAVALSLSHKVGPLTARRLIAHFGGAEEIFRAGRRELQRLPGIGHEIAASLTDPSLLESAQQQLEWADRAGIGHVSCLDEAYPHRLRPYEDSPVVLYSRGSTDLARPRIVSVVGTRTPTERGKSFVQQFVRDLAPMDVTVISGMALGIDIAVHRACHAAGIPTIGVMAHGLHTVFPPSHAGFAEELCEGGGGGLLSEFPLGTQPRKEFFPLRNRIVAALADAVVVVESNQRGGSMITAQLANDYQKDVFAVPGRPDDAKSAGCNLLIKTHRAAMLESAADLADLLRWSRPGEAPRSARIQHHLFAELTAEETEVVEWFRERDSIPLDELLGRGGRSAGALSALLLELELKGVLRALPGKMYALA